MNYLHLFKMPKPVKITGRSSSITNSFVNSIIPVIQPTEGQVKEALTILGILDNYQCVYCGDTATEWDHLRPLVLNKKPTGYISEVQNLVPACGKCNQSKGNKNWGAWMVSDAPLSPKKRNIPDIKERIEKLKKYETWGTAIQMDFQEILEKEDWEQHWKNCERIQETMRNAQILAAKINVEIADAYKKL